MNRVDEDRRLAARRIAREEIDQVARHLADRFPEVEAIWLFGSYARGEERRTSDLDLAVMASPEVARDFYYQCDLAHAAEDLLRDVPVDVVVLHVDRSPALLWEILSLPVLLLARDPQDAAAFASGLRSMVRDEWPRLERRWERTRKWLEGLADAAPV